MSDTRVRRAAAIAVSAASLADRDSTASSAAATLDRRAAASTCSGVAETDRPVRVAAAVVRPFGDISVWVIPALRQHW